METAQLLRGIFLLSFLAQWVKSNVVTEGRMTSNPEDDITTESTAVATTVQSFRNPRWYKRGYHDEEEEDDDQDDDENADDHGQNKAISHGKIDYWGGYYDFLINEGSYKFWAAFQLATAALLIYSGFAALYYAKVNPTTNDDYDDYFLRRRRKRSDAFLGLEPETFQRIIDAVSNEYQPH